MENTISAIIPVYNEDKIIEENLKSLKGNVDEIIVIHDGKCKDDTVKISKKYTNKVYEIEHRGRSAFLVIPALKKAKGNWILKLDADESLSPDLQKNIRNLVEEENIDGYSFVHPLWDGRKTISRKWPRKTVLVRKNKIRYIAFPGFDMNLPIEGNVREVDYTIFHKPQKNQDVGWAGYKEKVLQRYAPNQAKWLMRDFSEFETYQYNKKDFPRRILFRRQFPLLSGFVFAILSPAKQFFSGGWKEGLPAYETMLKTFIYNFYLGYLLRKEKNKKN